MVVGEAPGADEDAQGEPFVGRAGQLLNKILAAINFRREDVYICNILKCRPPGNRKPQAEEVERCIPYLRKQIGLVQPKVILCLGLTAAENLLNTTESLSSLRSRVHRYEGTPLMVTYHPAALLRNPNWKRPTWEDVQAARKLHDELIASS
jgi:DNA polymerase